MYRMKSLDDAALRAKAVIDKAHELSQNMSIEEAKQKANQFSTLDIAFAGRYQFSLSLVNFL